MRNILDKVVDKIKIHILSSITFQLKIMLFILWKNTSQTGYR